MSVTSSLEEYVRHLVHINAVHNRKGTTLGKEDWREVVAHLREEVREFADAIDPTNEVDGRAKRENAIAELGDILGIVVHAAVKLGGTMKEVEQVEIEKLRLRFHRFKLLLQDGTVTYLSTLPTWPTYDAAVVIIDLREPMRYVKNQYGLLDKTPSLSDDLAAHQ